MTNDERARRERDLIEYYGNEVRARAERDLPDKRVARRTAYLQQVDREGRRSLLEIGCGPGRDAQAIVSAGFGYTGVDLAPASVDVCRSHGLDARVASVLALPFDDATFDAGWTMSTLLHIADDDLDQALSEIIRVLRPGAPLAIGLWGDTTAREQVGKTTRASVPADSSASAQTPPYAKPSNATPSWKTGRPGTTTTACIISGRFSARACERLGASGLAAQSV